MIDIPDPARSAAEIVIATMRKAGMCPSKARSVPICRDLAIAWVRGEITESQFVSSLKKVLILNPMLKLK